MSEQALEQAGRLSLRDHLVAQAVVAHRKHFNAGALNLASLLADPDAVRFPVRLVFEIGEMAAHQFAQPDIDWRDTSNDGRAIYLRPSLKERSDLIPLAVVYMIPAINYGEIVSDDECIAYGATLLGLTTEEYYWKLCALADFSGATPELKRVVPIP